MNKVQLPLEGITVVSLEHAIAAPFCTRQLADMGARVIKVERPDGGDFARGYDERVKGLASHFVWVNRGKESLAIDVKSQKGQAVLQALLAKADVLVQNLAPGASERLGLSYSQLSEKYPRLIVCDISGYGQNGRYQDKKAYDLLIQSESGLLSVTGGPAPDQMAKTGISIADICAGMYAYSGILNALLLRSKTGEGSHLDVSMLECLTEWLGFPLYYSIDDQSPPLRTWASHATIYPYGIFSCQDGMVLFGLQNQREWQQFCQIVLQQPELSEDPRFIQNSKRVENREALKQIIETTFTTLSSEQIRQRLDTGAIANAQVNTMAEVWQHPQLQDRQRWCQIDSPVGRLPALLPPVQSNRFTAQMGAVPALGQHNQAIFNELGLEVEDDS
ncbi:CoA transferase [Mergibacter septicus]|uniref:CaiB/BaiF CoA transferase family protein n=1 Tax=Mergibacter septicus TaxID=221402 RepID=UPI001C7456B1|nr:CaiB/BaiF CoA-transferase family protein [Mergibacter septicus]QDJ13130.1 CoA transferase [Mergibacter septicus]